MKRILIIDDDFQIRLMLQMTFEQHGYTVRLAANGKEGLTQCGEFSPHVVITDIIMPEMDGTEAIIKMREYNPEVQIIAISGGGRNSPEGYLFVAEQLGAVRTFYKPIDRGELLDAVESLIANQGTA